MYHLRLYQPCGQLLKLSGNFLCQFSVFCILQCFYSSLFQQSLSFYIYSIHFCSSALLGFYSLSPFSLCISIFSLSLFHFFLIKGNCFICIIITCIFIFSLGLCVHVCFTGDSVRSILSGVWSRLSLLSMIPSTCGIKFLFLPISS